MQTFGPFRIERCATFPQYARLLAQGPLFGAPECETPMVSPIPEPARSYLAGCALVVLGGLLLSLGDDIRKETSAVLPDLMAATKHTWLA